MTDKPVWIVPAPPRHVPALHEHSRHIVRVELLVLFFAAAAPGLVFGLSGITDPQTVQTDVAVLTLIASMLASLGPASVAVYLLWRDGFLRVAGFGPPRAVALLGQSALGFVCCVGAVMVVGVIITVLRGLPEDGTSVATDGDRPDLTIGYLLVALAISATAGLSEEVVYRGYGVTRMEQAGWPRAALVVPTAVWTAQHLYGAHRAPGGRGGRRPPGMAVLVETLDLAARDRPRPLRRVRVRAEHRPLTLTPAGRSPASGW